LAPQEPLEVENMSGLPELMVGTFDSNGNLTGPGRGEVWNVKVKGDVIRHTRKGHSPAMYKAGSDGKCSCAGLEVS
jgi:hypothetical protein